SFNILLFRARVTVIDNFTLMSALVAISPLTNVCTGVILKTTPHKDRLTVFARYHLKKTLTRTAPSDHTFSREPPSSAENGAEAGKAAYHSPSLLNPQRSVPVIGRHEVRALLARA
ncbi:MAG: hypothetical protein LUC50_00355, partial [Ruminococcus sp.]|nr:hypothetical protein [Ruminococcus sp.]